MLKILVIDDEPQIRRVVRHVLEEEGAEVFEAASAKEGIDLAAAHRPALIILDLGLPDGSGLAVCREIRSWSATPIIVLSARHSDRDKVALLDAGVDDYVTKPFSPTELQARVRAHLRRSAAVDGGQTEVHVDALRVDLARRVLWKDREEIHLTPTEWDLLRVLIRHAGRTLPHQHLFAEVWPHSSGDAQAYLRVHLSNLRRKIERDPLRPDLIITEPGVGYRFRALD